MRLKFYCSVFCLLICLEGYSQIGGRFAFESSNLPPNARLSALGGSLITVIDDDVALAQLNPAALDSVMDNQFSINHNFHFAGTQNGNLAFGKYLPKYGLTAHVAFQYMDYGTFDLTDAIGNINGEFSAGEYGFVLGVGKQLNERIRGGINFKTFIANYESYGAFAMGVDLGLHYQKPGSLTTWGIVLRNLGGELNPIVDDKRWLPFDLQIGMSKRLQHLPFRFSIIAHQMQKWYIRYDDPDVDNQTDIFGNVTSKSGFSKSVDNLFRHLIFNGEFLIGKQEQFRIRFGYNHLRKQELKVSTFRSLAGFSFGLGFNIKKIKFDYGWGYYHIAGANNHLSLRLNMDRIFNKI
ncbi:MAG: type IX secretion system protein PorQ [Saprospiraceae bacterium]|nr:type IX secretion system protein PorQ [Saprospiraceae bacterium]